MQSSWVKKFDAGQRNPYPEKQAKALPCTSSSAWYRSRQSTRADLKTLGHQVLLCFPRRFGRHVHPTEQPQSSTPGVLCTHSKAVPLRGGEHRNTSQQPQAAEQGQLLWGGNRGDTNCFFSSENTKRQDEFPSV